MPISRSLKPSTQHNPVVFAWNDFSGGLNADYANYPLALSENELAEILNYRYVKQGGLVKLRSRDGLTKASTGTAGGAIKDYCVYTIPAGTSYEMVVADSDLKRFTGGQFYKVDDLYTAGGDARGRMVQFNNKLIIVDGSAIKYWDGTTFGILYDMPTTYLKDYDNLDSAATSVNGSLYSGATVKRAQLFVATHPLLMTSVTVYLKKVGSPTGNITFVVYAADGTTVVATGSTTVDSATLTTSYVQTVFSVSASLSASTTYFLAVLYSGGDSSNYVDVRLTQPGYDNIVGVSYAYIASWAATGSDLVMGITPDVSPFATWVIQKRNRLYCNHIPVNTLESPNRLYFCNANDPNDWSTVGGGGYIIFEGHYKLNGAYVYNNSIYVFADQPKAVYRLTGDSPLEYAIQDQPLRGVTAISQDVIQDIGSDLIFQDSKGIISLRSLVETGDIEKSIISKDKVNRTYVLPYTSQVSGKNVTDNQYWLTTTGNYVLVYDQELGCWTRFQFELGTSVTPTCFGINSGLTYIGDSAGNLWYLDYTKTQDNGVDFSLIAKPAWTDFGVLFDKDARFADCVVISANQETYDLEVYINLSTTAIKTLSLVSLSQNGAYQSPYCGNLNEVNFNFKQIQAKVTAIASGTGPHWLDRIVIEAAVLPHY